MSTKRTYRPSRTKRAKTHGFRIRNRTRKSRKVIKRRRLKKRQTLVPD